MDSDSLNRQVFGRGYYYRFFFLTGVAAVEARGRFGGRATLGLGYFLLLVGIWILFSAFLQGKRSVTSVPSAEGRSSWQTCCG